MPEPVWAHLGLVEDLKKTPLAQLKVGRTPIALTYRNGDFFAVSGVCNHVGGPLGEGRLDGRLRRVPVAQLQVPSSDGRGRAGVRGGRVPSYELKVEGGRLLRQPDSGDAASQGAARAAPARAAARAGGRARPACSASRRRRWTSRIPATRPPTRCSRPRSRTRPASSEARREIAATDGAFVPALRGLLLEERARLHVALLDHPDGPERPARPRLRGDRPLGRRDPRLDADPLGRGELALLQDGRADELRPEPDHPSRTAC